MFLLGCEQLFHRMDISIGYQPNAFHFLSCCLQAELSYRSAIRIGDLQKQSIAAGNTLIGGRQSRMPPV
jgi:hypothetical protein